MGEVQDTPKLCTRMVLWELPDQYIWEPIDLSPSTGFLSMNRATGDLSSISELPDLNGAHAQIVFGLVGLLRLFVGTYALVITGHKRLGLYKGHPIYKVTSMKVLSCNKNLPAASVDEKENEAPFVSLLKSLESTPGLYFSYNSDLTSKLRTITKGSTSVIDGSLNLKTRLSAGRSEDVGGSIPLWKQAEEKYLWNKTLLDDLIQNKLEPFILPLIQGKFQTIESEVKGEAVKVSLIARRCNRRTGTRMWRRGADMDGNVANFVESEQILETKGYLASYTQVRGSIPLLWEQIVDLTYKPKIRTNNNENTPIVIEKHFKDLQRRYGDVLAIDLINQKGSEGVLSVAYGENMQRITNESIRYLPFDFHHICGHIHFERLSNLYDDIREDLSTQGYFLKGPNEKIQEVQKGVVRTNCVDCLERTNVTQSLLGRKALEIQLKRIGTFEENDPIEQFEDLEEKFKFLWADHGDDISIQYSGTGALKGDFVRYGKMGVQGLIQDGFKSAARYYYNNFRDGFKQDSMDLVAGHYTVNRETRSPLRRDNVTAILLGFAIGSPLILAITGMIAEVVFMERCLDTYKYMYTLLRAGAIAGLAGLCMSLYAFLVGLISIQQLVATGASSISVLVDVVVAGPLHELFLRFFRMQWSSDGDKVMSDLLLAGLIGLWIAVILGKIFVLTSRPHLCKLS